MPGIIVTDGEQRAALAVVRSLGHAGHKVTITSADGRSIAGASRYARDDVAVPSALYRPDAFLDAVVSLSARTGAAMILPIAEPSVLALLPGRDRLLPAIVPFPSLDAFQRASDKVAITAAAARVGIHVPEQVILERRTGLERLPDWTAEGIVIKPGRSISDGQKLSVSYVPAGASIPHAVDDLPGAAFPALLQRRIVGPGTGVFLLRWHGRTRAAFAHERIREKPPSGGVSVQRRSVPLDPDLLRRSEALLEALDWEGVAMLEFKHATASRTPYLMEINGRFWGSLQLAIDAGVDFPELLVQAALGRDTGPPPAYRPGVRSRWLLGDVDHLIARMRHPAGALNLPADAPGRASVLAAFLRDFLPPNRLEVCRFTDPTPFFREVRLWLRSLRRAP